MENKTSLSNNHKKQKIVLLNISRLLLRYYSYLNYVHAVKSWTSHNRIDVPNTLPSAWNILYLVHAKCAFNVCSSCHEKLVVRVYLVSKYPCFIWKTFHLSIVSRDGRLRVPVCTQRRASTSRWFFLESVFFYRDV